MKLALGTVQFGLNYGVANTTGQVSSEAAGKVLQRARQSGMDTLDTAIAYGDSEAVLGGLGVQSWRVITKLSAVPDGCEDVARWVKAQARASIQRLGVHSLHGLLLHRPGQLLLDIGPSLYAALLSLKAEGLAHKIGVSVYGPAELEPLFGRYSFDLVQAPLNILDRGLVESGWAERLKQAGVEVHTRSAFLQGLLLMPAHIRPARFNHWVEVWDEWDRWLSATGLTPLQGCLRYPNSLHTIDRVVVGVDTVEQLDQVLEAASGELAGLPHFNPLPDDRLINPARWNEL